METLQTKYTQNVEDIDDLLKSRWQASQALNQELTTLHEKLRKATRENAAVVLVTIPFSEVVVTFGNQQMHNFFKGLSYPKGGLFLREVQFVLVQNLTDEGIRTAIHAKFFLSDPGFNGYVALGNLSFDDEYKRISEQVVGLGYNPCFASKEKYEEVRNILKEVRDMLRSKAEEHITQDAE